MKKTICYSVAKAFDFFRNSTVPFHRVTFDKSVSCVLLIDKPNESCQKSKKFKRKSVSTAKKKLLKRKGNSTQTSQVVPNFTNFCKTPKINNSNLSNEKKRTYNEASTISRANIKSIFASYC